MPVNTPSKQYENMLPRWQRCRDTFEGSDAVKGRGTRYLPALESHATDASGYAAYVMRALFFNAMGRTVQGLAGGIFQKPPSINAPSSILDHTADITLGNRSLDMFALGATEEVLVTGRHGVLVELPGEESAAARPYWVEYRAEDIISSRTERRGGDEVLTLVVLKETVHEPDAEDPFVLKEITQYRVLGLGAVIDGGPDVYAQSVWRKRTDITGDEWIVTETIIPTRRGEPLTFVPFVFLGSKSVSAKIEKPPLVDLADVNLSHYRGSADHKHGLHQVALPTPWVAGMKGGDDGEPLPLGSGVVWELDENGKAGMLEFTGAGLDAIRQDMQDMQAMMATLGAKLLEEQPRVAETATAVGMRQSGEQATLRTIAQSVEQGLSMALQFHAWWVGTEATPADVEASVELNKDFLSVKASPEEVKALLLAWQSDAISFETLYFGLQGGEWARPGVSAEDELAAIRRGGGGTQVAAA